MLVPAIATTVAPTRLHSLTSRQATETKIRMASKTAKDVANVVVWLDPGLISAVPLLDYATNDGKAGIEKVINGNSEAILVHASQMLEVRELWWWTIKVGAYEDDEVRQYSRCIGMFAYRSA